MTDQMNMKMGSPEKAEPKVFVKDTSDNKLFPQIQVKDLSKYIDEFTRAKLDGDGIVWKAASCVETAYIVAVHKETGDEFEMKNRTEFKGAVRTGYSENSWLGVQNIKREAAKQELLTLEDFDIIDKQKLNFKSEEEAMKQIQMIIRTKLKELRQQFGIDIIDFCIGEGDCFRHDLDLPTAYKGTRKEERPLMLKQARQWILDELNGELAPTGFENDDYVEWFGFQGYQAYRKTGIFSFIVIAEDKDAMGNPKMLINFGREDKGFKYPNAWLIEDSSKNVGEIDLVVGSKKQVKGTGIKWLILQAMCVGDSADGYMPYLKFPKEMREHIKYGDTTAYNDFVSLDNPKDIIQKAVDNMAKWFPYGLQYTNHKGEELDVDTLHWMNTCFAVAYMTRSATDDMNFTRLANAFKVDLSAVTENNKYTAPIKTLKDSENVEKELANVQDICDNKILPQLKAYKSLKKGDLVERMDDIKVLMEELSSVLGGNFHEMKSQLKVKEQ